MVSHVSGVVIPPAKSAQHGIPDISMPKLIAMYIFAVSWSVDTIQSFLSSGKTHELLVMLLSSLGPLGLLGTLATAQSTFTPARPPSLPLAVKSPYLSTWFPAGSDGGNGGYLPGQWPSFYTWVPLRLYMTQS
jgi:hypothetical protein